ncbi:MAG: 3-isopropylmalate dehydrogenase, partial [Thiotrichales bacterium]|nr:3-isopropylmalate dehydrogenase [Thiotrichales bacterium]
MTKEVLILPGDGIGPEITAEAVKVLEALKQSDGLDIAMTEDLVGGAAYDVHGVPLADETMAKAKAADAVLLGAVGGYKWESLDISVRPEKGLLRLRSEMELFANLRPAYLFKQLADASTLKP